MTKNEWALLAAGALLAGVGVKAAVSITSASPGGELAGVTGPSGMPPRSEGARNVAGFSLNASMQGISGDANLLGVDAHGGLTAESRLLHFFMPNGPMKGANPPNQSYRYVRHRYPNVTGTNINTLIHRGYSPLMVPAPQDYDWIVNPPSEQIV